MDHTKLISILDDITSVIKKDPDRGEVANYIPELSGADTSQFAISVALADGNVISAGDSNIPFSIQSISKIFSLALALGKIGDQLWNRVGREPSGLRFDSILMLEQENGRPRNPFINAGAIATTDVVLAGSSPKEALGQLLQFVRTAADDPQIFINNAVAKSEIHSGHRNFALAHYLLSCGNLHNTPEMVLGTYFHQCAIEMTTEQLARSGRFLIDAPTMPRLISPARIRRINALMMTCGHYDGSGDFAYRVGLPGKSGVGGGILATVPGIASIAVWSPGLNEYGNSKLGTQAMQHISDTTQWSVF